MKNYNGYYIKYNSHHKLLYFLIEYQKMDNNKIIIN